MAVSVSLDGLVASPANMVTAPVLFPEFLPTLQMPSSISVRRLYDEPDRADGTRILVDGLWPRGIRRSAWPGRSWLPELAPSRELRRWFGHHPERFGEFSRRYRAELDRNPEVEELLSLDGPLTLITAKRDVEHSHAEVLRVHLEESDRRM